MTLLRSALTSNGCLPVFLSVGGTYIFGFFALIALGSLIFAIKLPETKDKSLEQIQKELVK